MVFLKQNLLIRVVIVFVIFYWKVNGDCMESLKTDGFDKRTGFQNLASRVGNFEVKDEDTDFYVPQEYKLRVEKAINFYESYKSQDHLLHYLSLTDHTYQEVFQKIEHELTDYGLSYVYHLIELVKKPEQMLPPETWCKILECLESNENLKSDTPFDKYINYVSKKINKISPANCNCFIKTCHDQLITPIEIPIMDTNEKNDQATNGEIKMLEGFTGFNGLFFQTYNTYDKKFFRRSPLTWCAIQACYNSMLEWGFDNVPTKFNKLLLTKLSSLDEDTYVAGFSRFLDPNYPIFVTKKQNNIYSLLFKTKNSNPVSAAPAVSNNSSSPDSSYLYDLYEYPINWCAVKICHDDLINAGFTFTELSDEFNTFEKNFDVLPKIKQTLENSIGKRIVEIFDEIIYLLFGNTIEYYITEYINGYIGKIIGDLFGGYTKNLTVTLMNNFLGEFLGIKIKQYFTKKCKYEDPSLYIQMLFEYILLLDEKYKVYQSEFVSKYCFHLEKLKLKTSEDTNKNYIPADREKRTPFDWCMFTVVHETLQL